MYQRPGLGLSSKYSSYGPLTDVGDPDYLLCGRTVGSSLALEQVLDYSVRCIVTDVINDQKR